MVTEAVSPVSSLRAYRPLLITLLLTFFVLLLVETGVVSRERGIEALQTRAETHLDRYVLSLQQKLDRYKDLPRLLSTHSDLTRALLPDQGADALQQANRYLERVNEIMGTTDVYLMSPQGVTVAASNWRSEQTFIGRNFSFRPYFQAAMAGREGRYFALGTTSKRRGYYFSYPLRLQGQQQVLGVVVVKVDLHDVERHWSNPQIDLLVTDPDGVIFISTRPEWKFRALQPLPPEDMERILASLRYGDYELNSLEVLKREPLAGGAQMITLLDSRRGDGSIEGALEPRQLLLQRKEVPGFGLSVSVLASLAPVRQQMMSTLLLVGFSVAAAALLVLFLLARRRIIKERTRFQHREMLALEENEARVRAIIDNTQAGLIMLDASGAIESINPTAERLFACSLEQLRGQYFSRLLAEPDRALVWRHLLADEGDIPERLLLEATGVRRDGSSLPLGLSINRMTLASMRHFIITLQDLTERKEYERQLKSAQEALEARVQERTADLIRANAKLREEMEQHRHTQNELIQTAKLAIIGQMSAGINHELNQPLTAIRNYADNARAFLERGQLAPVKTNLQEISGLTDRMSRIISPLKEFARKSSGSAELVSLQAVRDGAMSLMYGRFEKAGVEIHWPHRLAGCYVLGDMLRLEQVMVNLLSNALQAMEQGGGQCIEVTVEHRGERMLISVHDQGPGIREEELERVFEPFYTTKKPAQGLGLGLSISHRIITTMGGALSVANHPQGGAVFTIELPSAQAPESKAESSRRKPTHE